jgi:hypothetical protein
MERRNRSLPPFLSGESERERHGEEESGRKGKKR